VVDTTTGAYQSALDSDGVHPNEAGYQQMGYAIAASLALIYPDPQPGNALVGHNAAVTGQLQTKPLALGSPTDGVDYGNLSGIGTGTVGPSANSNFLGGQGYLFSRGDTDLNSRLATMVFVEGHRMRIGLSLEAVVTPSGTWGIRLESDTTGTKIIWALGYSTANTLAQSAGRFFAEFTVPTLPDYTYRLRISVTGASGTSLHLGEVTMQDLTAMGA
jgi:hypothetical protein